MDLIAEHSGVTKRTLYNQFGSKDHLVAVYLTERDRRWRSLVQATVDASATPRDAVLAPFEALATWSTTNTRGCAFINALAELPDPAHPAHRIATAQKLWLLDLFETLAAAADCPAPTPLARAPPPPRGRPRHPAPPLDTLTEATALARTLITSATRH
ncbi:TetR/AcrR family transcriptional regulator [Actinomadura keratinilytica]